MDKPTRALYAAALLVIAGSVSFLAVKKASVPAARPTATAAPSASPGSTYASAALGLSFTYPKGWYVTEDAASQRIYVANAPGILDRESQPPGYERVWLSAAAYETSAAAEAHTKAGSPDCCTYSGEVIPVTAGTVTSGSLTISTYTFKADIEAYWAGPSGARYFATIQTPDSSQADEIATLRALLATVRLSTK